MTDVYCLTEQCVCNPEFSKRQFDVKGFKHVSAKISKGINSLYVIQILTGNTLMCIRNIQYLFLSY